MNIFAAGKRRHGKNDSAGRAHLLAIDAEGNIDPGWSEVMPATRKGGLVGRWLASTTLDSGGIVAPANLPAAHLIFSAGMSRPP